MHPQAPQEYVFRVRLYGFRFAKSTRGVYHGEGWWRLTADFDGRAVHTRDRVCVAEEPIVAWDDEAAFEYHVRAQDMATLPQRWLSLWVRYGEMRGDGWQAEAKANLHEIATGGRAVSVPVLARWEREGVYYEDGVGTMEFVAEMEQVSTVEMWFRSAVVELTGHPQLGLAVQQSTAVVLCYNVLSDSHPPAETGVVWWSGGGAIHFDSIAPLLVECSLTDLIDGNGVRFQLQALPPDATQGTPAAAGVWLPSPHAGGADSGYHPPADARLRRLLAEFVVPLAPCLRDVVPGRASHVAPFSADGPRCHVSGQLEFSALPAFTQGTQAAAPSLALPSRRVVADVGLQHPHPTSHASPAGPTTWFPDRYTSIRRADHTEEVCPPPYISPAPPSPAPPVRQPLPPESGSGVSAADGRSHFHRGVYGEAGRPLHVSPARHPHPTRTPQLPVGEVEAPHRHVRHARQNHQAEPISARPHDAHSYQSSWDRHEIAEHIVASGRATPSRAAPLRSPRPSHGRGGSRGEGPWRGEPSDTGDGATTLRRENAELRRLAEQSAWQREQPSTSTSTYAQDLSYDVQCGAHGETVEGSKGTARSVSPRHPLHTSVMHHDDRKPMMLRYRRDWGQVPSSGYNKALPPPQNLLKSPGSQRSSGYVDSGFIPPPGYRERWGLASPPTRHYHPAKGARLPPHQLPQPGAKVGPSALRPATPLSSTLRDPQELRRVAGHPGRAYSSGVKGRAAVRSLSPQDLARSPTPDVRPGESLSQSRHAGAAGASLRGQGSRGAADTMARELQSLRSENAELWQRVAEQRSPSRSAQRGGRTPRGIDSDDGAPLPQDARYLSFNSSEDTTVTIRGRDISLGVAGVDYTGVRVPQLITAAAEGDARFVKDYFKKGPGKRAPPESQFFTPLHAACMGRPNPKVLRVLITNGADANAVSAEGDTPVHLLASNPTISIDSLCALLEGGARADVYNAQGLAAVHIAAQNTHDNGQRFLRYLIYQGGADIDQLTQRGETAVQLCEQDGCEDACAFLLEGGAS
eukprot:TRINITY_DN22338_c0_g1_i1.p1 TRINITY_DN22338_c0_g1~~TRINITY_DN22338_c0_g1_i1.p1  ORF type:complete len:1032 (+),score=124.82 TRINITY_DN22338_c0_g1_i1:129-3224(+)